MRPWGSVAAFIVLTAASASTLYWGQSWTVPVANLGWVILVFAGVKWALAAKRSWALNAVLLGQGLWAAFLPTLGTLPPQIMPFFLSITMIALFLPPRRGLLIAGLVGATAVSLIDSVDLSQVRFDWPPQGTSFFVRYRGFFLLLPESAAILFGTLIRQSLVSSFAVEDLAGELTRTNQELTTALAHADELAATRERTRIARELHDSIGHYLTIGDIQLERVRYQLQSQSAAEHVSNPLLQARQAIQAGLRELRSCVSVLRENHPGPRLSSLIQELTRSLPHHTTKLRVIGDERRLATPIKFSVYRTVQEGLTNVARHAQAHQVAIELHYEPNAIHVSIE